MVEVEAMGGNKVKEVIEKVVVVTYKHKEVKMIEMVAVGMWKCKEVEVVICKHKLEEMMVVVIYKHKEEVIYYG